jgi:phage terminase large subunit
MPSPEKIKIIPIAGHYPELEGLYSPSFRTYFYQPQFKGLYQRPEGTRLVINIGPRGSGKSYEASRMTIYEAIENNKRIAVMRDEKTSIKDSALTEIQNRFDELNELTHGYVSDNFVMQNNVMKAVNSNNNLIFTKGFKASSNTKQANLKSLADIDIAYIEELQDIETELKFNTFCDGVRNKDSFVIVNINPPDKEHWFIRRYFDLEETEHEGYFKLIPKNIPGVVYILTDYTQNIYLNEVLALKYKSYGDERSHTYDKHYYLTQILGYVSSGRVGQILTGWSRITNTYFNDLPYRSVYGLDFGSTSPTALVECKYHDNLAYYRELIYEPGLDNTLDLAIKLLKLGITQKDIIIADSAKPLEIGRLRRGWTKNELSNEVLMAYPELLKGFNIHGAVKGPGSVENGIKELKALKNHVTAESANFWNEEYPKYCWDIDRNGNPTDIPIDDFNHLIDAIRYARSGKGRLF